jgi:uncharacterized protein
VNAYTQLAHREDAHIRLSMLIHELSPQDCREIIRGAQVARLGCAHDDQPYIVPISYSFDAARDCLYCFSAVGQKILWMRDNPKVCAEIDEIRDKDHWATVLVFGRYEEILDSDSDSDARERALALFQTRTEWWLPGAAHLTARERQAVIVYRIQIERVSGRRASRDSI